jgi:hypothetical protein
MDEEPGVVRRLAAILAADVVGYSRLMEADEAGTHARLARSTSSPGSPSTTVVSLSSPAMARWSSSQVS